MFKTNLWNFFETKAAKAFPTPLIIRPFRYFLYIPVKLSAFSEFSQICRSFLIRKKMGDRVLLVIFSVDWLLYFLSLSLSFLLLMLYCFLYLFSVCFKTSVFARVSQPVYCLLISRLWQNLINAPLLAYQNIFALE